MESDMEKFGIKIWNAATKKENDAKKIINLKDKMFIKFIVHKKLWEWSKIIDKKVQAAPCLIKVIKCSRIDQLRDGPYKKRQITQNNAD